MKVIIKEVGLAIELDILDQVDVPIVLLLLDNFMTLLDRNNQNYISHFDKDVLRGA